MKTLKTGLMGALKLAIAALLFYGCQKNNISTTSDSQSYLIPENIAREIANKLPSSYFEGEQNKANKTTGEERKVSEIIPVNDVDHIPLVYCVNYENNNGFVIISADIRHEPLLAVVPEGNFRNDTVPSALLDWFEIGLTRIEMIREANIDSSSYSYDLWLALFDEVGVDVPPAIYKPNPDGTFDPPPPPNPCPPSKQVLGPLLDCEWGQGCTFNDLCPDKYCNNFPCNSKAYAGCVAVAMAQVIHYWGTHGYSGSITGGGYNFSSMPLKSGNFEVQRLIEDAGTYVNMNYGCSGSGANGAIVDNKLKSKFGFATAEYDPISANANQIITDLNVAQPVLLEGCRTRIDHKFLFIKWSTYEDCHMWVCDGYKKERRNCRTTTYFHMNWGWKDGRYPNNPSFNGWYLDYNWNIPGINYHYQYIRHYVHNIHF